MLMRKPVSAYDVFIEALKEEREDLFDIVKEIATKHGYKSGRFLVICIECMYRTSFLV